MHRELYGGAPRGISEPADRPRDPAGAARTTLRPRRRQARAPRHSFGARPVSERPACSTSSPRERSRRGRQDRPRGVFRVAVSALRAAARAFAAFGIAGAFEDARADGAQLTPRRARHRAFMRATDCARCSRNEADRAHRRRSAVGRLRHARVSRVSRRAAVAARRGFFSERFARSSSSSITRAAKHWTDSSAKAPSAIGAAARRATRCDVWSRASGRTIRAVAKRAIERVCDLAEGKPYFAEELVNSAVMAPRRPVRSSTAEHSRRRSRSIRAARRPRNAACLLYASVIGRSFDVPLLAQIAARLGRRQRRPSFRALATCSSCARSRESPGALTFRHAITREILYRELLAFQTQTIHREIAECLAQAARHRSPRPRLPLERRRRSRTGERGIRARGRQQRSSRNAHRDAEAAYRGAAASRVADDATYALICEKFSRALSINGNVEEACAVAEQAVNAYEAAGDADARRRSGDSARAAHLRER